MRSLKTFSLTFLLVAFGAASSSAQQSTAADGDGTVSATVLAATLAAHESVADKQRARLADLLARDDVREVADDRGIDLEQVQAAAAGLSDAQLEAIAPLVDDIPQSSNGGLGSITIGVGALIVILLVLILVT